MSGIGPAHGPSVALTASVGSTASLSATVALHSEGNRSLLPDASPLSGAALNDAMSGLYLALSQLRNASLTSNQDRVQENRTLRNKALADQLLAAQQQEEDAKSGGFWQDVENVAMTVAKVAFAVSAVAAAVATGGVALPVAAVALSLSVGGIAVSETKVFGDKASGWVSLGMEAGGAALTFGATLLQSTSSIASSAGQAASGASSAGSAGQTLVTVGRVANGIGGAADTVGAVAHVEVSQYAADVQDAAADVVQSNYQKDRLDQLTTWIIGNMQSDEKSFKHAQASLQSAMQTNDETAVTAASISVKG